MTSRRATRRLLWLAAIAAFGVAIAFGLIWNSRGPDEVAAIAWRQCAEWYAAARTPWDSGLVDARIPAPGIQRPLRYAKRCKNLRLDTATARRP